MTSATAADAAHGSPDAAIADRVLSVWRTHCRWLCLLGIGSVVAGVLYYILANGVDGRDAFYAAVAIQFVTWGAIDALFGLRGLSDVRRERNAPPLTLLAKRDTIVRVLGWNRWLNALWLTSGVALLGSGLWMQSPSLCGHGVGVLAQAIALTFGDELFMARLRRAHA